MSHTRFWSLLACAGSALLVACPESPVIPPIPPPGARDAGGQPAQDAGPTADAGPSTDAGPEPDAGTPDRLLFEVPISPQGGGAGGDALASASVLAPPGAVTAPLTVEIWLLGDSASAPITLGDTTFSAAAQRGPAVRVRFSDPLVEVPGGELLLALPAPAGADALVPIVELDTSGWAPRDDDGDLLVVPGLAGDLFVRLPLRPAESLATIGLPDTLSGCVGPRGLGCDDTDTDGLPDVRDNCANAANLEQLDGDDDGHGDACDLCPGAFDADQADTNGDGVGDACDACVRADGTSRDCDDGDACNGTERCDSRRGCLAGDGLDCDDGLVCNGVETCAAAVGCIAGDALDCDDANSCTTDSCDDATGCIFAPEPSCGLELTVEPGTAAAGAAGQSLLSVSASADAVLSSTTITVEHTPELTGRPAGQDEIAASAHTFEPDGTVFEQPLDITLPILPGMVPDNATVTPNAVVSVQQFDPMADVWQPAMLTDGTPITAQVSADAASLTFQTDHFTSFGITMPCFPLCLTECGSNGCGGSCGGCDDDDECTADTCGVDGSCEHTLLNSCATAPVCTTHLDCEDENPCTVDLCKTDGTCRFSVRADGFQCGALDCENVAQCVSGACVPANPGNARCDLDWDGVWDDADNCVGEMNPSQADTDGDQIGDSCDADLDGDQVDNDLDNCPFAPNPGQADTGGDSRGDVCAAFVIDDSNTLINEENPLYFGGYGPRYLAPFGAGGSVLVASHADRVVEFGSVGKLQPRTFSTRTAWSRILARRQSGASIELFDDTTSSRRVILSAESPLLSPRWLLRHARSGTFSGRWKLFRFGEALVEEEVAMDYQLTNSWDCTGLAAADDAVFVGCTASNVMSVWRHDDATGAQTELPVALPGSTEAPNALVVYAEGSQQRVAILPWGAGSLSPAPTPLTRAADDEVGPWSTLPGFEGGYISSLAVNDGKLLGLGVGLHQFGDTYCAMRWEGGAWQGVGKLPAGEQPHLHSAVNADGLLYFAGEGLWRLDGNSCVREPLPDYWFEDAQIQAMTVYEGRLVVSLDDVRGGTYRFIRLQGIRRSPASSVLVRTQEQNGWEPLMPGGGDDFGVPHIYAVTAAAGDVYAVRGRGPSYKANDVVRVLRWSEDSWSQVGSTLTLEPDQSETGDHVKIEAMHTDGDYTWLAGDFGFYQRGSNNPCNFGPTECEEDESCVRKLYINTFWNSCYRVQGDVALMRVGADGSVVQERVTGTANNVRTAGRGLFVSGNLYLPPERDGSNSPYGGGPWAVVYQERNTQLWRPLASGAVAFDVAPGGVILAGVGTLADGRELRGWVRWTPGGFGELHTDVTFDEGPYVAPPTVDVVGDRVCIGGGDLVSAGGIPLTAAERSACTRADGTWKTLQGVVVGVRGDTVVYAVPWVGLATWDGVNTRVLSDDLPISMAAGGSSVVRGAEVFARSASWRGLLRHTEAPFSPADADRDGDGADNAAELAGGSSPHTPHSDGDGISDGEEIIMGTNPAASDTDGDTIDDDFDLCPTLFNALAETGLADCNDGLDNDCDGAIDCMDSECQGVVCASSDGADLCTQDGVCLSNGTCTGVQSTGCSDSNGCTTDSCVPATGCAYADVVCTAPNECTFASCLSTGASSYQCQTDTLTYEGDPCAADANACTSEVCRSGACASEIDYAMNFQPCDDGEVCTRDECMDGACAATGVAPAPDDMDACTVDLCLPGTGELHEACPGAFDCVTEAGVCQDTVDGTVYVAAGAFQMGCNPDLVDFCQPANTPYHEVTLSAFEIHRTEVTVGQFDACVQAAGCSTPLVNFAPNCPNDTVGTPDFPATCMSHGDAAEYCGWEGMRLCTEAEWEKAARGPDGRRFTVALGAKKVMFGVAGGGTFTGTYAISIDGTDYTYAADAETRSEIATALAPIVDEHAGVSASYLAPAFVVVTGDALGDDFSWAASAPASSGFTTEVSWGATCDLANSFGCGDVALDVGSVPQGMSPYGAFDMLGNVYEWVADWYAADALTTHATTDPTGPASGTLRVRRSGGWGTPTTSTWTRGSADPATAPARTGFRCCRDAP